ncbi:amino acid adenylation domain-containing protein [Plantactinospora sp. WMMC1484]|uniref:amino acid adenylation domain-containing protein n=1 Tax=Plantactinospora sp. WMMC1484 TaxID=3404122 RepID=UPI003BF5BB88
MTGSALLPELILRRAHDRPQAPAVVWAGGTLTYHELLQRAGRVAELLRNLGVQPESPVAVLVRPGPDLVVALLGIWQAGGAYLPLDQQRQGDRRRRIIAATQVRVALTDRSGSAIQLGLPDVVQVCRLADLNGAELPPDPPVRTTLATQAAYVIFTSGSTGEPKGVVIDHAGLANRVRWGIRALGLSAEDRILQKTPLTFDAAGWEIFAPLVCGAPVVFGRADSHRDAATLVASVRDVGATVLQVVPSLLRLLVAEPELRSCRSLRVLCSAGEPLHAELCQQLLAQLDVEIWNTYGPTECAIDVTATRFDPATRSGPVPIGEPIDNMRCLLLRPDGRPADADETAELYACGPGVGRGYHRDPALTADRFLPDPSGPPGARMYRTGDLVHRLPDGGLRFVGRTDAQVKINGVRVEPTEVEAALTRHPQVREAAVRAATDPGGQSRLVAYVVAAAAHPAGPGALAAHLRNDLPSAAVPALFLEIGELPRTHSGKLDRSRLPEPDWGASGTRSSTDPETAEQAVIIRVWRQLLGRRDIGLDDDFFGLGGHSLMLTRLAAGVTEASGLTLDLGDLYRQATPRGQAELLARAMRACPLPVLPPGARLPLSRAQERFWLLDRLHPGSPEYLVPIVVRLSAQVPAATVEEALRLLALRHDVLRSRFPVDRDGPYVAISETVRVPLRQVATDTVEEQRRHVADDLTTGLDLAAAPPWRASLHQTDGAEQLLLVVCHHIISDGWSTGLLDREIRELVAAVHERRSPRLRDLPLRYVDFAAWQRSQLTDEVRASQLAYWRTTLAGLPDLELPGTRRRDTWRSAEGALVTGSLPPAMTSALIEAGRRVGASPFAVFLTLWTVVLGRAAGAWDFGVGISHAGRSRPESHHLVGPLINTVVVRSRLDPHQSFGQALERVAWVCREAFAHDAVPFESVVDAVEGRRDRSRTPLFQTLFALVDEELVGPPPRPEEIEFAREAWSVTRTDLDLTLWSRRDGTVTALLTHASPLYDQATAETLLKQFATLAGSFAEDPDGLLGDA